MQLFPIQVKRKEKDILPKRHFKVYQQKGEGGLFYNQSNIWERKNFLFGFLAKIYGHTLVRGCQKCFKDGQPFCNSDDKILIKVRNFTLCSVGTGVACPHYESSCVGTNCLGRPTSFHKPRRQLPASRSLQSHRF